MSTDGWAQLADGVRKAAAQIDRLAPQDHADGHRALLRALNNRLSRIENDGGPPELEPFNGWREKFFMDNPNYRIASPKNLHTGCHRDGPELETKQ